MVLFVFVVKGSLKKKLFQGWKALLCVFWHQLFSKLDNTALVLNFVAEFLYIVKLVYMNWANILDLKYAQYATCFKFNLSRTRKTCAQNMDSPHENLKFLIWKKAKCRKRIAGTVANFNWTTTSQHPLSCTNTIWINSGWAFLLFHIYAKNSVHVPRFDVFIYKVLFEEPFQDAYCFRKDSAFK